MVSVISVFNLNLDLLELEGFVEELDVPDLVLVVGLAVTVDNASTLYTSCSRFSFPED